MFNTFTAAMIRGVRAIKNKKIEKLLYYDIQIAFQVAKVIKWWGR